MKISLSFWSLQPNRGAFMIGLSDAFTHYRFQDKMIEERDAYIEAIKRVIADEKIPAGRFKELVATMVKDEKVTEEILRSVPVANIGNRK
jgi:hypothetical protein